MSFDPGAYRSSADLLAVTRVMDERSAERYRELAEAFDLSCNPDAAEAFRELAATMDRHAAELPAVAGGAPGVPVPFEQDPEIADPGAVHYLMYPWHVYDLAQQIEERSLGFYEVLSTKAPTEDARAEAVRLAARERGHLAEIKSRQAELPVPPEDWDDDPDPPNWDM